jgi:hypothetical protein
LKSWLETHRTVADSAAAEFFRSGLWPTEDQLDETASIDAVRKAFASVPPDAGHVDDHATLHLRLAALRMLRPDAAHLLAQDVMVAEDVATTRHRHAPTGSIAELRSTDLDFLTAVARRRTAGVLLDEAAYLGEGDGDYRGRWTRQITTDPRIGPAVVDSAERRLLRMSRGADLPIPRWMVAFVFWVSLLITVTELVTLPLLPRICFIASTSAAIAYISHRLVAWPPARSSVATVALIALVSILVGFAARAVFSRPDRPATFSQEQIVSGARRNGLRLVADGGFPNPIKTRLRPDGTRSLVYVFAPVRQNSTASDELRVYDEIGTSARYRQVLRYRAKPYVSPPVAVKTSAALGILAARAPERFGIDIAGRPRNLDDTPGADLLLQLREEIGGIAIFPRPLILRWSAKTKRYALTALLSPASIRRPVTDIVTARYSPSAQTIAGYLRQFRYGTPTTVADAFQHESSLLAYPVELMVCNREPVHRPSGTTHDGIALTVGYIVKARSINAPLLMQPVTWHIDLGAGRVRAIPETDPEDPIDLGGAPEREQPALRRASLGGPPCVGP